MFSSADMYILILNTIDQTVTLKKAVRTVNILSAKQFIMATEFK